VNSPPGVSIGPALAKVAAFAAVLLPVSVYALYHAIRLGQRRGTIIEY
jgi:hypothetical protein